MSWRTEAEIEDDTLVDSLRTYSNAHYVIGQAPGQLLHRAANKIERLERENAELHSSRAKCINRADKMEEECLQWEARAIGMFHHVKPDVTCGEVQASAQRHAERVHCVEKIAAAAGELAGRVRHVAEYLATAGFRDHGRELLMACEAFRGSLQSMGVEPTLDTPPKESA